VVFAIYHSFTPVPQREALGYGSVCYLYRLPLPRSESERSEFLLRACYGGAAWAANQLEGKIESGS